MSDATIWSVINGTARFKKCKQLLEYQNLLLLKRAVPLMTLQIVASLTDNFRDVIYNQNMFIAAGQWSMILSSGSSSSTSNNQSLLAY